VRQVAYSCHDGAFGVRPMTSGERWADLSTLAPLSISGLDRGMVAGLRHWLRRPKSCKPTFVTGAKRP